MKTLCEDLMSPLNEVERAWIRKPSTVLLTPFVFIVTMIIVIFTVFPTQYWHFIKWTWLNFTVKCWNGEKDT